ncbi:hypothetical protein NKDENANG_00871 [Candidatus Entotheonellaceae bacterium PAL068K]
MPDSRLNEARCRQRFWQRLGDMAWLVVGGRCLVGGVFLVAGFSKLMLPQAEVVALMQPYRVIPAALTPLLAATLPWLEVASGTALVIGLYTTPAALLVGAQLVAFSLLMVVVLATGVVIEDCGCFGNLGWQETPFQVLIRDLIMLALLAPVLARQRDVLAFDTRKGNQ